MGCLINAAAKSPSLVFWKNTLIIAHGVVLEAQAVGKSLNKKFSYVVAI
jgi:hypothetical protein